MPSAAHPPEPVRRRDPHRRQRILTAAARSFDTADGGEVDMYLIAFGDDDGAQSEALGTANAELPIDPNDAALYSIRSSAETSLGQYEQAKSDALQAIRLSPRDPFVGGWHLGLGDAELNLGHFESAIEA